MALIRSLLSLNDSHGLDLQILLMNLLFMLVFWTFARFRVGKFGLID